MDLNRRNLGTVQLGPETDLSDVCAGTAFSTNS
jgi:hypothetical protein